jgi:hypothetical protein
MAFVLRRPRPGPSSQPHARSRRWSAICWPASWCGRRRGPFTPGFVADQALATELAEIGVILLMFGVGLHFSLKDLLSVRAIAIPARSCRSPWRPCWAWAWAMGWAGRWARAGVRPGALGRQHRRAAARPAGAPPASRRARPHRRRLADRRGPGHGAGAGPAAGAGGLHGASGRRRARGLLGLRSASPCSRSRPSSAHAGGRPAR